MSKKSWFFLSLKKCTSQFGPMERSRNNENPVRQWSPGHSDCGL